MRKKNAKKTMKLLKKKKFNEPVLVLYDVNEDAFEWAGHNFLTLKDFHQTFRICKKEFNN
jgi:hypothetical protein